jgi:hypothetical protein
MQADQYLSGPQQREVGRHRRPDTHDDVGLRVQLLLVDQPGTGLGIVGIGEPRPLAGAGLDEHVVPGGPQASDAVRGQRNTAFMGSVLGHRSDD